jgi:predicted nucleotidyltransferase
MATSTEYSQVLAALDESVCSDSDIVFAVAFGSQTTGEQTQSSDFDLAVKFVDGLPARERFEKRCFLSGELQDEDLPFIDVSDFESLPLAFAHDAVHGDLICGDEQAFEQFKTEIETKFDEQRETLRRQQRAVIDRIAEEGLRG